MDTLNFCFWPTDWEYDNLAKSIKLLNLKDPNILKPENLAKLSKEFVQKELFQGKDFPLLDERVRLLNEIGLVTLKYF